MLNKTDKHSQCGCQLISPSYSDRSFTFKNFPSFPGRLKIRYLPKSEQKQKSYRSRGGHYV